MSRPKKGRTKTIFARVTAEQHAEISAIARDRGLSLNDLVPSSIIGSTPISVVGRLSQLEARVSVLERIEGARAAALRKVGR